MFYYTKNLLDETKHILFDSYIAGEYSYFRTFKRTKSSNNTFYNFGNIFIYKYKFFIKRFNPKRVVLPRDMMFSEIESIVTNHINQEFEVFFYMVIVADGVMDIVMLNMVMKVLIKVCHFVCILKILQKTIPRLNSLFKAQIKIKHFL